MPKEAVKQTSDPAKIAFENWWDELTRKGDPARLWNVVEKAFIAGWRAKEEADD